MDGSEKLIPFVIEKFLKPWCMKNCKPLFVVYETNKKEWMTEDKWKKKQMIGSKISKQNRNDAMIVVNCTAAHNVIGGLKLSELIFLLPKSACVSQPLDQEIIKNCQLSKAFSIKDMITAIGKKEEFQVSVLNAIFYVDQSWNMVSYTTIENCFGHAGFNNLPELKIYITTQMKILPYLHLHRNCGIMDVK